MSLHVFSNRQILVPSSTFFSKQDYELNLKKVFGQKLKQNLKQNLELKLILPVEFYHQSFPVLSLSKLDRKPFHKTPFVFKDGSSSKKNIQPFSRTTHIAFAESGLEKKSVDPLDERVESTKEILKDDLPRQYDGDINWDVYCDNVVFVDPVTRSFIDGDDLWKSLILLANPVQGKLLYRGMIGTIRLLSMTIFLKGTSFVLHSIEEVDANASTTSPFSPRKLEIDIFPKRALRTVWTTKAQSRWGTDLFISGDDIFRFDKNGLIITHESAWNEDPTIVWDQLRP